ncbi:MAG: putative ABC transport system permease protein [Planctomycetota bacterium]|jgi:putative ABC transport system permease protein
MKLAKLVLKNLLRRKGRTLLSIGGIASALMLMLLVQSLSIGLEQAMSGSEAARTLVVYRKNRYCPQTSNLPDVYRSRIEEVPGVESVLPVQVYLNNCRASLDLVTFQGAPAESLLAARDLRVVEGDEAAFLAQDDAALVGIDFAKKKGLSSGDVFQFGGIDVKVAGIFESTQKTEQSLILTHLDFLRYSMPMPRDGSVTQYEVKVADAQSAKDVAAQIDALFATAEEPTDTRPQIAFLERATKDLAEILRFGRWLGFACVIVVLSLIANTIFMSMQERVREFGVFRTLGFQDTQVAGLVISEAVALAACGALLGVGGALLMIATTHLSIGTEGVTVAFAATTELLLHGLAVALAVGLLAGIMPAVSCMRISITESLRS